jgi:microcystin-dependent protein
MSTGFVGEIRLVGFNFNPQGWHLCDGSILSIAESETLYTLLGTTYGGDGVNTFALPDLRGRVPIHQGAAAGLYPYVMGQTGGVTSVTLTTTQLPLHSHPVAANSAAGTANSPTNQYFGATTESVYTTTGNPVGMGTIVGASGGSQPHENRQPYLAMNYVIALYGVYPSRS